MTLEQEYPTLYEKLKQAGHSPAKVVEILLDAKRGDLYALNWIKAVLLKALSEHYTLKALEESLKALELEERLHER